MGAVKGLLSSPQVAGEEPTCSLGRDGVPLDTLKLGGSGGQRGVPLPMALCSILLQTMFPYLDQAEDGSESLQDPEWRWACLSFSPVSLWSTEAILAGPRWSVNLGSPQSCIQCSHVGWAPLLSPSCHHHHQLCRKWFFSLCFSLFSHTYTLGAKGRRGQAGGPGPQHKQLLTGGAKIWL